MKIFKRLPVLLGILCLSSLLLSCGESVENGNMDAADVVPDDATEMVENIEDTEDYDPIEFTLVNNTDRPLLEFYVSPPSEATWGENLIPEDAYVGERSEVQVVINDSRPDCAYDILGVLGPTADGSVGEGELIHSGVEICDGTIYTYSQNE